MRTSRGGQRRQSRCGPYSMKVASSPNSIFGAGLSSSDSFRGVSKVQDFGLVRTSITYNYFHVEGSGVAVAEACSAQAFPMVAILSHNIGDGHCA